MVLEKLNVPWQDFIGGTEEKARNAAVSRQLSEKQAETITSPPTVSITLRKGVCVRVKYIQNSMRNKSKANQRIYCMCLSVKVTCLWRECDERNGDEIAFQHIRNQNLQKREYQVRHICLSAWNNSTAAECIFIKSDTEISKVCPYIPCFVKVQWK